MKVGGRAAANLLLSGGIDAAFFVARADFVNVLRAYSVSSALLQPRTLSSRRQGCNF